MIIYLFTRNSNDVPQLVPPVLSGEDVQFKHVKFESIQLNDLLLIAKYRIINFPMSVITDDRGNILLKVKGAVPASHFNTVLESN